MEIRISYFYYKIYFIANWLKRQHAILSVFYWLSPITTSLESFNNSLNIMIVIVRCIMFTEKTMTFFLIGPIKNYYSNHSLNWCSRKKKWYFNESKGHLPSNFIDHRYRTQRMKLYYWLNRVCTIILPNEFWNQKVRISINHAHWFYFPFILLK